jgi:hypothetical protein
MNRPRKDRPFDRAPILFAEIRLDEGSLLFTPRRRREVTLQPAIEIGERGARNAPLHARRFMPRRDIGVERAKIPTSNHGQSRSVAPNAHRRTILQLSVLCPLSERLRTPTMCSTQMSDFALQIPNSP